MNPVRTVTFELLRHGPPHNQLLSPITPYLALCGSHSAVTVNVPFEHNQLLVRLNALLYKDSPETRKLQLKDTAQIMADLLGEVPGLVAELAECPCPARADLPGTLPENAGANLAETLTHLRLILSSSELALLPFELANAPNGFPGAGQALGLQAQAPVCITREVRRVCAPVQWPRKPRILFAAAQPPSVGPIPLESHLLALRRAIDPWVPHADGVGDLKELLGSHLVVLPQANPGSIRTACAEGNFTHVHILAHGVRSPKEEEKRYALALHDEHDPARTDYVDGARLATLLRTYRDDGSNLLSQPGVVSIASCDSGQQGSVVGAGSSVAHALHEGGIPLVVAAQFPLSFVASVMMVEVLYDGLLWGHDPRTVLTNLRWQLKSRVPETHDWASLVAYASLPNDLREQLPRVRFRQARGSIAAALRNMDRVTQRFVRFSATGTGSGYEDSNLWKRHLRLTRKKTARALSKLHDLLDDTATDKGAERADIYGLIASAEKREAKVLFQASKLSAIKGTGSGATVDDADQSMSASELIREAQNYLELARINYRKALREDSACTWAIVQEMALATILEGAKAIDAKRWNDARILSENDLNATSPQRVEWALANLIELHLLAVLRPEILTSRSATPALEFAQNEAKRYARELAKGGEDSIEVYSTRRQVERYADWFSEYEQLGAAKPLAVELLAILPHNPRFE